VIILQIFPHATSCLKRTVKFSNLLQVIMYIGVITISPEFDYQELRFQ
jgi:hypothetical protein